MMQQWYYVQNGKQQGPVNLEELRDLAAAGTIDAMTLVWNKEMRDWTPASEIDGIFSSSPSPTAEPTSPPAAPSASTDNAGSQSPLQEIEPGSEALDIGIIFNRAIELTKRNIEKLLILGAIIYAITSVLSLALSIGQGTGSPFINPMEIFSQEKPSPEELEAATKLDQADITRILINSLIQQFVGLYLSLGLYRCCLKMLSGRPVEISMLFGEGRLLLRAFGATLLMALAMTVGFLLLIVPGIYLALRFSQVIPAIVDRDMSILEAIEYSAKITKGNLLMLFVLWIVIFIIAFAIIMITCGLGTIIVTPVIGLVTMLIYRIFQYGHKAAMDKPGTQSPVLSDLHDV